MKTKEKILMFQRTIALVTLWIFLCSDVSFALRPRPIEEAGRGKPVAKKDRVGSPADAGVVLHEGNVIISQTGLPVPNGVSIALPAGNPIILSYSDTTGLIANGLQGGLQNFGILVTINFASSDTARDIVLLNTHNNRRGVISMPLNYGNVKEVFDQILPPAPQSPVATLQAPTTGVTVRSMVPAVKVPSAAAPQAEAINELLAAAETMISEELVLSRWMEEQILSNGIINTQHGLTTRAPTREMNDEFVRRGNQIEGKFRMALQKTRDTSVLSSVFKRLRPRDECERVEALIEERIRELEQAQPRAAQPLPSEFAAPQAGENLEAFKEWVGIRRGVTTGEVVYALYNRSAETVELRGEGGRTVIIQPGITVDPWTAKRPEIGLSNLLIAIAKAKRIKLVLDERDGVVVGMKAPDAEADKRLRAAFAEIIAMHETGHEVWDKILCKAGAFKVSKPEERERFATLFAKAAVLGIYALEELERMQMRSILDFCYSPAGESVLTRNERDFFDRLFYEGDERLRYNRYGEYNLIEALKKVGIDYGAVGSMIHIQDFSFGGDPTLQRSLARLIESGKLDAMARGPEGQAGATTARAYVGDIEHVWTGAERTRAIVLTDGRRTEYNSAARFAEILDGFFLAEGHMMKCSISERDPYKIVFGFTKSDGTRGFSTGDIDPLIDNPVSIINSINAIVATARGVTPPIMSAAPAAATGEILTISDFGRITLSPEVQEALQAVIGSEPVQETLQRYITTDEMLYSEFETKLRKAIAVSLQGPVKTYQIQYHLISAIGRIAIEKRRIYATQRRNDRAAALSSPAAAPQVENIGVGGIYSFEGSTYLMHVTISHDVGTIGVIFRQVATGKFGSVQDVSKGQEVLTPDRTHSIKVLRVDESGDMAQFKITPIVVAPAPVPLARPNLSAAVLGAI
jgi:hypothetical protein